ncbi:MAG: ornithine cyclodeaminase family protein [Candidatus Omnitrophica bacterium]|nr:ornithine cyclodeaminase family protein [Candidatus Omnitrophota bacterium]
MRRTTLLLTQREVARLIDLRTAIQIVRESFKAMARGEAVMPPKLYLPLPHRSDFRAMPAFLQRPAACGVKWVNVHPHNRVRGLPTVMAVIVINDPSTGFPLAVMDGLFITKLRTAAAAAVAARALATRTSRVLGLVGCGAQADTLVLAHAEIFRLIQVKAWGYFPHEAQRFCRRMRRLLPRVAFEPCATIERSVRDVDLLVTVTPSRRPLVKRAWLAPGTHISALGADAPGKQELDPRILHGATIVVDDRTQAIHAGELNVPIRRGQLSPRRIHATLGDVLIGRKPGRRSPDELTVFDSTGLAIHDVALGYEAVRQARRQGVARSLAFFT